MMASMVPSCTVPTVGAGVGREFTIAPDGDFVIRLTPPVTKPIAESPVNKPVARPRIFEFRVSRGILITHSAFFQHLFRIQPTLSIVSFENNNISRSLEIWLRAIHNDADNIHSAFRSLRARHSEQVWITIAVGQQFGFVPQHTTVLKPWFLAHYKDTLSTKGPGLIPFVARSLALPCALFDHAEGFMKLTKYLAFNTNSALFTENFSTLGVDARSLDGPLTAARAHVQSTLERGLYYPLERLHSAVCICRKETAFDYEDALISLGCWPLDDVAQKFSLSELFEKLTSFDFQPVGMGCESGECRRSFKRSVEIAISRAKQSFHGLCLDCMNRSKPVIGQSHEDYIKKNSPHVGYWDMDCRFGHGRPSWFYSWMGPSSARTRILDNHRHELREKDEREGKGTVAQRPRRAPKDSSNGAHIHVDRHTATSSLSHRAMRSASGSSDKENNHEDHNSGHLDIDNDEEFFDAEEQTYLDDCAASRALDG